MTMQTDAKRTVEDSRVFLPIAAGLGDIPLRSLCRRPLLVINPFSSLQETMATLNLAGGDAGLVAEKVDTPLGIVTLQNLLDGIALQGGRLDDPVIAFMTVAPQSLPADAPAHRAKVLMTRCRLTHLLLTEDGGRIFNLISQADIPGYRDGGANELIDQIEAGKDIDSLAMVAADVRKRGAGLFASGMGAEALCLWLTGLNDLISMRVIEMTADQFDLPPVSWNWMVFGSEGRMEQTFWTDQDNGLIFQPDREGDVEATRQAFLPFAKAVNQALDRCGFTLCVGNIMAGNPTWCLSAQEWRDKFKQWMEVPEPDAIMHATIFFDFRPLYGQDELVDELRSWLLPQPVQHPRFLHSLSTDALGCAPALGFMDRFVYDGGKEFPHTINLKAHGVRPFVDAARIWGLKYQSWATNTSDRLRSVASTMHRSLSDTGAVIEAFDLVQRLRIQQQLAAKDPEWSNRVDPRQLHDLQKLMLKEGMRQARLLQFRLKQEFTL